MNLNDPFVTLTLLHIICIAGGILLVLLLVLVCYCCHRRRRLRNSGDVRVEPVDII